MDPRAPQIHSHWTNNSIDTMTGGGLMFGNSQFAFAGENAQMQKQEHAAYAGLSFQQPNNAGQNNGGFNFGGANSGSGGGFNFNAAYKLGDENKLRQPLANATNNVEPVQKKVRAEDCLEFIESRRIGIPARGALPLPRGNPADPTPSMQLFDDFSGSKGEAKPPAAAPHAGIQVSNRAAVQAVQPSPRTPTVEGGCGTPGPIRAGIKALQGSMPLRMW